MRKSRPSVGAQGYNSREETGGWELPQDSMGSTGQESDRRGRARLSLTYCTASLGSGYLRIGTVDMAGRDLRRPCIQSYYLVLFGTICTPYPLTSTKGTFANHRIFCAAPCHSENLLLSRATTRWSRLPPRVSYARTGQRPRLVEFRTVSVV